MYIYNQDGLFKGCIFGWSSMWFSCICLCVQRVRSVTKSHFIDHRNKKKLTAEGLFAKSNTELRNASIDWLKHTAEGCSIVAVLIVTVAFAAAYTIPGGPNQNTGVPVLSMNLSLWFSQQLMYSHLPVL